RAMENISAPTAWDQPLGDPSFLNGTCTIARSCASRAKFQRPTILTKSAVRERSLQLYGSSRNAGYRKQRLTNRTTAVQFPVSPCFAHNWKARRLSDRSHPRAREPNAL